MSAVELKALHDSFVELWMQQPYGCSLDFFQKVLMPACEKVASCNRGRGKLAGTIGCNANVSLCRLSMLSVYLQLLSPKLD